MSTRGIRVILYNTVQKSKIQIDDVKQNLSSVILYRNRMQQPLLGLAQNNAACWDRFYTILYCIYVIYCNL